MFIREYPEGLDCVWIASDRDGYVGAFVTGGHGPIPKQALQSEWIPVEDIEDAICQLPQSSSARLLIPMSRPDSFIDIGVRGLFVYDWRDVHRTKRESTNLYEAIVVPASPVTLDVLPEALSKMVATIRFWDLLFVEEQSVDACVRFDCIKSE